MTAQSIDNCHFTTAYFVYQRSLKQSLLVKFEVRSTLEVVHQQNLIKQIAVELQQLLWQCVTSIFSSL